MTALLEEKPASVTSRSAEQRKLLEQYSVGPIQFTGTNDALYERHLVFDNVVEPATIGARERFEAVGHSVRDFLSQRWIITSFRTSGAIGASIPRNLSGKNFPRGD